MPDTKIDKVEFARRIRAVMEWIIDDNPYTDIIAKIKQTWAVEERQAKRYVKAARDEWNQNENDLIEEKRTRRVESLKKLRRSLKEVHKGSPAGIMALLAVDREIIKLEGLERPKQVEVSGKNGKPIQTETVHKVIFEDYGD